MQSRSGKSCLVLDDSEVVGRTENVRHTPAPGLEFRMGIDIAAGRSGVAWSGYLWALKGRMVVDIGFGNVQLADSAPNMPVRGDSAIQVIE